MALEVLYETVHFPYGTGPRGKQKTVTFGSTVRTAGAALNGFYLHYKDGDHHIKDDRP